MPSTPRAYPSICRPRHAAGAPCLSAGLLRRSCRARTRIVLVRVGRSSWSSRRPRASRTTQSAESITGDDEVLQRAQQPGDREHFLGQRRAHDHHPRPRVVEDTCRLASGVAICTGNGANPDGAQERGVEREPVVQDERNPPSGATPSAASALPARFTRASSSAYVVCPVAVRARRGPLVLRARGVRRDTSRG